MKIVIEGTDVTAPMLNLIKTWYWDATPAHQKAFMDTKREDLVEYHHTLGQRIRNQFKLWEVEWEPKIINGGDHSPNHPDQLSMTVIERVWDELREVEGY